MYLDFLVRLSLVFYTEIKYFSSKNKSFLGMEREKFQHRFYRLIFLSTKGIWVFGPGARNFLVPFKRESHEF